MPDGAVEEIRIVIDGSAPKAITVAMLDEPVRDLNKVKFVKEVQRGSANGAVAVGNPTGSGATRKTGDVKFITLPGGVKMEMIWCGPGTFMMGSPATEAGRFDDEAIHPVKLTKGFWLGKYEVTQAQWESVTGENRSRFKGPERPVDSVSWDDCQRFIRKANVALGGVARLPTEAEWEYACRAGSGAAIAGNGHLGDMAWYDGNSDSQTHPVGKNQANDWGFYDMHGNVLEWCHDWFAKTEGQAVDPKGPPNGSFKVLRGGCWFFYERDCRSAYRLKREPSIRNCIYGFRLACSEKGQE
jgi:formylglycine-generating enzyme required for sulfatase activity